MSNSVRPHRWQPSRLCHPWDSPGKNTGVGCHFLLQWMKVKSESEITQSCLTLSDPMDCSLPGSSIHGICQARVLEWVAIAFSDFTQHDNLWVHPCHCKCHCFILFNSWVILVCVCVCVHIWASLVACSAGDLGWENLLEEDMATHSSILAWRMPMDRGAWQATVHGVVKSQTQLSN